MTTSMREALEAAESWIERWTSHVGNCRGGNECTCGRTAILAECAAALSSPAPDRLSEEERRAVENLRTHQEQCDMDGVMVKVSRQAVDETLAIIDRLSRQPSHTEELTANISEQAQRVGATFVPSAEKIETYEAARAARQPEVEPVAWIEFADNGNIRFWTSDPARAWTEGDNGRPLRKFTLAELVALVATSPRLDREKVAATFKDAFDRAYMNAADEETAQDLAIEAGIDAIMRETR